VIKAIQETNGENLAKGFRNWQEDMERFMLGEPPQARRTTSSARTSR